MELEAIGTIATAISMAVVAVVNAIGNKKTTERIDKNHEETRNDMEVITLRHSILQMIQSDISNYYFFHKIPSNYNAIFDSYENYERRGGNHFVKEQVDDYRAWYESLEKQLDDYKTNN